MAESSGKAGTVIPCVAKWSTLYLDNSPESDMDLILASVASFPEMVSELLTILLQNINRLNIKNFSSMLTENFFRLVIEILLILQYLSEIVTKSTERNCIDKSN